jgi:hypothetical protein
MNFDQIKRAIVAKTKDKSNMPDWYYKRLEKCVGCEYNSGNVDKLSFKDRVRLAHNFGKDACLKCTCGVEDKSSDPIEECPEGFWGKEQIIPSDIVSIKTESKKVKFYYESNTKRYIADYGKIPYKYDSNISLLIAEKDLRDIKITTTCGCTVANTKNTINGVVVEIKYDTLRVGVFNKSTTIYYNRNNKPEQITITIKGEVNKIS